MAGSELSKRQNVDRTRKDGRLLGLDARIGRRKFVCSNHCCFSCHAVRMLRMASVRSSWAISRHGAISMNIRNIHLEATMTRAERPLDKVTLREARSAV